MAEESGTSPLPRRVPGATLSPRPPVRVEQLVIPEDLRQRVLTAIADEHQRDEAEARLAAQEQGTAGKLGIPAESGTARWWTRSRDEAAVQAGGDAPAGGAVAASLPAAGPQPVAGPGQADLPEPAPEPVAEPSPAPDESDVQAPVLGRDASQAAASAPTVWSPVPRPADPPAAADQDTSQAAAPTVWSPVPRAADPPAADQDTSQAAAPTVWSPIPRPADLPAAELDQAADQAPAPDKADLQAPATDQPAPAVDQPAPPPVTPPSQHAPGANGAPPPTAQEVPREFLRPSLMRRRLDSDAYTEPMPKISGSRADSPVAPDATHRAEDPATAPAPPAGPSLFQPMPPGSAPPESGEAGGTPPYDVFAERAAPPEFAEVPPPPDAEASPAPPAASPPAGPASAPPVVSLGPPAAAPKREGSGRRYRIAGLLVAVIALIAAAAIVLLLSSGRPAGKSGLGPPGAGAGQRDVAAAWVAGQVSRAAVVACDPVMCHALAAHGLPARDLYLLGPASTSPLHSAIIVATPQVRARFANLLSSGYAPAVLASFGSGMQRIEIRQMAQHGAAAYRARLGADLLSRKTSGAQLLRSNRIALAPIARQELSAGRVDSRLLITIAGMARVRPMYIFSFGSVAPGADPDLPLRFADLSVSGRAHRYFRPSPGYVRSMMLFLHAQRLPFRPAHVATVRLAGGAKALRIEFPAPSPLGLLDPHRA